MKTAACTLFAVSMAVQATNSGDFHVNAVVHRTQGWKFAARCAACPAVDTQEVVVDGIPLRMSRLDLECLRAEDVVEPEFSMRGGELTIADTWYRVLGGRRYEKDGETVMVRLEFAEMTSEPVEGGRMVSMIGGVFTYFYLRSQRGGAFDLRIEQRDPPPGIPDWARGASSIP